PTIYTLSLHDALPISGRATMRAVPQGRPYDGIREQAEVGAAAGWNVRAPAPERGRRHLRYPADRSLQPVGVRMPVGIPVARAAHRKQAGVVAVAFFDEDVERPFPARHDRETGR